MQVIALSFENLNPTHPIFSSAPAHSHTCPLHWHFFWEQKFLSKNQHSNTQPSKSASGKSAISSWNLRWLPVPIFAIFPIFLYSIPLLLPNPLVLAIYSVSHFCENFDLWPSNEDGLQGRENKRTAEQRT